MEGFGVDYSYLYKDQAQIHFIQNNIFAFSAAKNLTEFKEFSKLLLDKDGNIKAFNQFKQDIADLNIKFNKQYLKAEYDSAIAQSQMASKWKDFEDNIEAGSQLEYRTAGDSKVRPTHAQLDGLIADISDPVWNTIYPPNDWGCRCTVIQIDDPERIMNETEKIMAVKNADIPKYFNNNSGKTGVVYKNNHPYFKNAKGAVKQLKALNYNLNTPVKIYSDSAKLAKRTEPFNTIDEFKEWWADMVIKEGSGNSNEFQLISKASGINLTFDDKFYKRFTTDRKYLKENRYKLAVDFDNIINDPDEVWTVEKGIRKKSATELLTVYIKYFKDIPTVVVTKTKLKDAVRVSSIYNKPLDEINDFRAGILIYKKTNH